MTVAAQRDALLAEISVSDEGMMTNIVILT